MAEVELGKLAQDIELPEELDVSHRQVIQKLEKLFGAEFDRSYISQMLSDQKTTIAACERQSQQGQRLFPAPAHGTALLAAVRVSFSGTKNSLRSAYA